MPAPPERDDGRCRATSPSSWTATAAGRASAACRASSGHRKGVEAVRRTVRAAMELGIPYLTLYSFSSENWSRPADEIDDLMGLMKRFIRRDLAELHQDGVRSASSASATNVERELMALIDEAVELTRDNTAITLMIAFNYGSRAEIAKAARRAGRTGRSPARSTPADITPRR